MHGATLGILGMGRIGQAIARRGALGFGMRVIYHNRSRLAPELEAASRAQYVDKTALLREADHLVLVLPYSPQSHHAIGAGELAQMKPSATLTNIARGGIVDDAALAAALRAGSIAAAGLDVFEGEPRIHADLLDLPNVVITPHIGSASVRTRRAMAQLSVDNLIAALGCGPNAGRPPTPVNPQVLRRMTGMPALKVLVMGVAGCGKSTVAAGLAQALGALLIEGDEHHPPVQPGKDAQRHRAPGRRSRTVAGQAWRAAGRGASQRVLTCSALKRSYRDRLRAAEPALRIVYVESRWPRRIAASRRAPAISSRPAW